MTHNDLNAITVKWLKCEGSSNNPRYQGTLMKLKIFTAKILR
ncbi:Uncharacterised protein [Yersinia aldovae]|uniref:Uncharacterized protein n=1 Tax=Yersinia aldovae TaxID=29483 RepID=A0ABM9SUW8_YERAL|nr:Uncharacterised protein [Yersinia aldovae]